MFDDILRNTTHGVTPWRLRAGLIKIRIVIKPGNPTLWQGLSVRSSLNYYTFRFSLLRTKTNEFGPAIRACVHDAFGLKNHPFPPTLRLFGIEMGVNWRTFGCMLGSITQRFVQLKNLFINQIGRQITF